MSHPRQPQLLKPLSQTAVGGLVLQTMATLRGKGSDEPKEGINILVDLLRA